MSHWNYRLVRYVDGSGFGLHEVYYGDDKLPRAMTEDPISFACDLEEGPNGVRKSITQAHKDAIGRPIFDEPAKGSWPSKSL